MPRHQGGTFYTFGSAMEDIGLNINENYNKVEMSHYVLLDIPKFRNGVDGSLSDIYLDLNSELKYDSSIYTIDSSSQGDFMFADQFQNYCLNFETILRNQDRYNYASNKTVSERVFWKWLFSRIENDSSNDSSRFLEDGGYYYEKKEKAIAKGFGLIAAGSQRTDDSGLYNETFVQIPSSYGQMRVLFKKSIDENYLETKYSSSNTQGVIENISASDITVTFHMDSSSFDYPDPGTIVTVNDINLVTTNSSKTNQTISCKFTEDIESLPDSGQMSIDGNSRNYSSYEKILTSTGISPVAKYDSSTNEYEVRSNEFIDKLEVEFDISKLREYYDNESLTYDDIGMGKISDIGYTEQLYGDYRFNAILVYYSIYDSNKSKRLSTNAYGLYILDNAIESGSDDGMFYFPSIIKMKSTPNKNGSSYSFRINVKPTTAYSGDITISDNSSAAYSMAEDFNDVLRNLTTAVLAMKENTKNLYNFAQEHRNIQMLVSDTMEKINDVEQDLLNIKNGNFPYTASEILVKDKLYQYTISDTTIANILSGISVTYDNNYKLHIHINTTNLSGLSLNIANNIKKSINNGDYLDIISMVMLLTLKAKLNS